MNGYEKRTKEKKDAIIATAKELFFQHGIAKTSIADIAKKAKVSQVTIYNYFGSKNTLLLEVMKQHMIHGLNAGEELFLEDIPFKDKIKKALGMKRNQAPVMSKDFFDSIPWSDPDMQNLYQEMRTKSLTFAQKMFEQGKAEGVFHPSITFEAYLAYISAIDNIVTHPDFMKSSDEYKLAIERLVWYGLLGK